MRFSLAPVVPLLLVALGAAVPASAHDWLDEWRSARSDYHRLQAEFEHARVLETLDCAALTAYVADQNRQMNQWIYAEYHRPLSRSGAVSFPAGLGAASGSFTPSRR
jgi:hypothetical protein